MSSDRSKCEYDVCLSFASEDREYVQKVASEARKRNIHVFYDKYERVELWGKNLYDHLADVYKNQARFCVIFISEHYRRNLWTNHERKSAQDRAFRQYEEYLLPVRLDDTEIPGILDTIGYLDGRELSPTELAEMIEKRIMPENRSNYFPDNPANLFDLLAAEDDESKLQVKYCAQRFLKSLMLTSQKEREIVVKFLLHSCPEELPNNVHIEQGLLSRLTDTNVEDLREHLGKISPLGFLTIERVDKDHGYLGESSMVVLEWHDLTVEGIGQATDIARETLCLVANNYCEEHGMEALMRLDFSGLQEVNID